MAKCSRWWSLGLGTPREGLRGLSRRPPREGAEAGSGLMPERGGSSRNQASPAQSLEPLSWAAVGHLPDIKLDHDRGEQWEEAADSKSFLAPQSLSPHPHPGEREEGCGH